MIACVGELEAERERGETEAVLRAPGLGARGARALVIAYEPVWAIGTGKTATPDLAQEAHAFIKSLLDAPVLYGGSVKPDNAAELLSQPDVDGALVGGASLDPDSFVAICRSAAPYPLVALVILDGWGCAPPGPGNAVELAETPVFDRLWERYPHTTIGASGEAVGLPPGQMGNSEVGHLTIGSGRVLDQDLQRVNRAVASGSLLENEALVSALPAGERGGNVHLLGLVSHGGVHSHIDHLRALLELARARGHGRADVDPRVHRRPRRLAARSAVHDLAELPAERIATVAGRYYAMDRDKRWERTDLALAAITEGTDPEADDPIAAVQASYDAGRHRRVHRARSRCAGAPRLRPGDAAIFFNFRPDRGRQLSERLLARGFDLTTMTRYREDLDCPVAFPEQDVPQVLAEVLAEHGARQLHVAETEKYAHVTYFFNGGEEQEWPGETRILVPSPRDVPSYDHKPEMSGPEVADRVAAEIGDGYRFAGRQLRQPRHGRPHRRDPRCREGRRDGGRLPRHRAWPRSSAPTASA